MVAVDPPVTATPASDACGIVVAGARRATAAATCSPTAPCRAASRTIGRARRSPPITITRPTASSPRSTRAATWSERAAPGRSATCRSARCTRRAASGCAPSRSPRSTPKGRVAHAGTLRRARGPRCARFGARRTRRAASSPDRLDALVWALTELMLERPARPQIRRALIRTVATEGAPTRPADGSADRPRPASGLGGAGCRAPRSTGLVARGCAAARAEAKQRAAVAPPDRARVDSASRYGRRATMPPSPARADAEPDRLPLACA